MTDNSAPEESKPWGRMRTRIAIAVGVLLLVLVRAALPSLAEWATGWWARTYLGLEVAIEDVDLGLLAGHIAFDGLTLTPPRETSVDGTPGDAPAALLKWERAAVDLAWSDLLAGRLHLTEVSIQAPQVQFARQAVGSLDPLAGAAPIEIDPDEEGDDGKSGMPIAVDRVVVQAARLRIVEAEDESELLTLELDDVAFEDFALEGGEIALGGIGLNGPRLRIVRDFALRPTGPAIQAADAPIAAVAEEGTVEEAAEASPETRPLIAKIDIDSAEFSLLTGARDVRLVASLHAERIGHDATTTFPLQLSMEADDGMLELKGEMALSPFVFTGDLRWNNLPIPLIAVSLRPDLSEWVRTCRAGGEVSVDIDLSGRAGRPPSIRIAGNAEVSKLEILDPRDGALSLTLKNAKTTIENLTIPLDEDATETLQIHLANVHIDEPNATYTHPSDAIERLLRGPEKVVGVEVAEKEVAEKEVEVEGEGDVAAEPSSEKSRPVEIILRDVEVRNGLVHLTDESVTPKYEVVAREFSADLGGMSLGGPVVIESVDASFRSRGNTRARIVGRLGSRSGEFDVDLDRVALPPLNGYAATAGIEVVQGALSSESKVHRNGAVWTFDNDLTLHQLKLDPQGSEGFRDSVGMPTDVILALLRDTGGDISLPVEFSVGGSEAGVGVSSSITSALRQALVGAASIPLKSVGSLLSLRGGGMRVEAIPAEPGYSTLAPGSAERVSGLSSLLETRPKLGISLVGSAGDDDRDVLAGLILAENLEAGGDFPESVETDSGIFSRRRVSRALRDRASGEASPLEEDDEKLLLEYVEATEVPEDRYRELARQRAQRVLEELVTAEGVSPERVRISEEVSDDDSGVEIEFFISE